MAMENTPITDDPFPADDDLVVIADDGHIYWLKKSDYTDEKFKISQTARLADQVDLLGRQGVLLADVRASNTIGVGAACFLVNLRGIRRQSPKVKDAPLSQPQRLKEDEEEPLQAGEGGETSEGLHS